MSEKGKDSATTTPTPAPIYLDYNTTCPMDAKVREVVKDAVDNLWADASSPDEGGQACKAAVEKARLKVAVMINATPEEIIFTSGGTEANNMVIYSAMQAYHQFKSNRPVKPMFEEAVSKLPDIPHIITSTIEHISVSGLLNFLESKRLCQVTKVPVEASTGAYSEFDVINAIKPNTCLITLIFANAETGVLQPAGSVGQFLVEKNTQRVEQVLPTIRLHTDATQTIGKIVVDMQEESAVDYMTISGHKFYGPRIGALFVRKGSPIHPMLFGGRQEKSIRPGSENTPMIVGLGKAAELVTEKLRADMRVMSEVRDHLEMRLLESFGADAVVNCSRAERLPNTSSVTFKCWRGGTAVDLLATCKRFVASPGTDTISGKIRPSANLVACGVPKEAAMRTVRFSVGRGTSVADIGAVIKELCEVIGPTQE